MPWKINTTDAPALIEAQKVFNAEDDRRAKRKGVLQRHERSS